MDCGTEIRIFDPQRRPSDWSGIVRSAQCVVFLRDRFTSEARDGDGKRYPDPGDATCFVFDHFEDARRFCEAKTQSIPNLSCAVYDAGGLANPPLFVSAGPDGRQPRRFGAVSVRIRRTVAAVMFLAAPVLVWIDMRRDNVLIFPTFVALNFVLVGVRLIAWDFGRNREEEDRRERLAAHLREERSANSID